MVTTYFSSSLGEQVGNPDSSAGERSGQLTSLTGRF